MTQRRLERLGALAGIAFVVLQMAGQSLIQVGGSEPPFTGEAGEIAGFFAARNSVLFQIGDYLSTLSFVVVLGFAATLWAALRRAEGEVGWLTVAATASGLIMVSLGIGGGYWSMAVFRVEDGLDPQVARTLFDLGNFTFANTWVALAGLAFAVGLAALFRNAFPRWLGWASLVLSAALLIARAAWTTPVAFVPYMLFWLWLIVLSVILYRRAPGATKITG